MDEANPSEKEEKDYGSGDDDGECDTGISRGYKPEAYDIDGKRNS